MKNKGISLLEIIIAMAILAIILMVVIPSLSRFKSQQNLKNATEDIISLLDKARSQTLSSKNSSNYGVHFEPAKVVLFTGGTYSSLAADNKEITFPNSIEVLSGGISLNGSGVDVVFNRLTGETSQYGTIAIQLLSDATKQKIITINKNGIISTN